MMSKVNFKIPGLCWPQLAWGHEGRRCAIVPEISQARWTFTGLGLIRADEKSSSLENSGCLPSRTLTPARHPSLASRHFSSFHSSSRNTCKGD